MTVLNRSTGDVINTYYYNSVQDGSIQADGFFAIQMAKDGSRFQVITGNPPATNSYSRSIALLFFERQSDGTYTQTGYDVVGSYDIKYTTPILQSDSMNRTLVVQTKDSENGGHTILHAVYRMDETGTFSRINNIASYVGNSSSTFMAADAIISSDGNYLYYGLNKAYTQVSTYKFAKVKLTDTGTELGHGDTAPDDDIVTLELPYTISDPLYKKFNLYGNVTKFSADMANLFLNINDGKIYHYTLNEDEKSYSLFQQYDDGGARSVDISYDSSKLYISDRRYIKEYEIKESISLNETDPFGDGSLKHLWKLDGNLDDSVGGLALQDVNNRIGNGLSFVDGKFGQAIRFEASDGNNVLTADNAIYTDNCSIVVWFKQDNDASNNDAGNILINENDNSCRVVLGTNSASAGAGNTQKSVLDEDYQRDVWNMAVATFSTDTVKFYMNGELKGENSPFDNGSRRLININVGHRNSYNTSFKGVIDHIQIFDRVLTDDEVTQLYNAEG
jgi:hypothetical protein